MNNLLFKTVFGAALFAAALITAFIWIEARKEIVFLCGNFTEGITEQSVRRQLDTGNFLRYRTENLPAGKQIIADSWYNLSTCKCTVDIDTMGQVVESRLD
ncbi:MAG: hypothetical protein R3281_12805 [Balneolaceae bacterium]|nr:hypothetical protein [Balneolaceae bacterium]